MAVYPDTEALDDLAADLPGRHADAILAAGVAYGELTFEVTLSGLTRLVEALRTDPDCRFTTLVDITGVDHPQRPARFDVGYQLNPVEGLLVDGAPQKRRFRMHFSIGQAF